VLRYLSLTNLLNNTVVNRSVTRLLFYILSHISYWPIPTTEKCLKGKQSEWVFGSSTLLKGVTRISKSNNGCLSKSPSDDPNTHSLCFPLRHFSVVGMSQYEMWLRDLLFIQKCSSLWDRTEIPNYDILIDILESLIKVSQQ
jgi:hypothetical protein